jgi:hypothetical protein
MADEEDGFTLATFPAELDFEFAVAVFELGLRHSSPRVRGCALFSDSNVSSSL